MSKGFWALVMGTRSYNFLLILRGYPDSRAPNHQFYPILPLAENLSKIVLSEHVTAQKLVWTKINVLLWLLPTNLIPEKLFTISFYPPEV